MVEIVTFAIDHSVDVLRYSFLCYRDNLLMLDTPPRHEQNSAVKVDAAQMLSSSHSSPPKAVSVVGVNCTLMPIFFVQTFKWHENSSTVNNCNLFRCVHVVLFSIVYQPGKK